MEATAGFPLVIRIQNGQVAQACYHCEDSNSRGANVTSPVAASVSEGAATQPLHVSISAPTDSGSIRVLIHIGSSSSHMTEFIERHGVLVTVNTCE